MIEGELVRLRPIGPDDLSLLRRWFEDPETMRHWGTGAPLVTPHAFQDDLQGRFARFDEAGYFMIEPAEGSPIGRIDFERLSARIRSAEVMILIGDPSARGKGYGTDAMIALLRYLFHERNLHRVSLTVLAWNERAIRSYEKVGFVVEGRLRDDHFFDGRYHDQMVMGMLRPAFDARWGSASAE
ncbi:MAG: GNAT family N-acetyltransferase [Thermomicrobiales bacterium]